MPARHVLRLLLSISLVACAPSLNLPPAPEVEPVLEAFNNPTAEVDADTMATAAEGIDRARGDIESSTFFQETLDVVVVVQQELDAATVDGNLDIGGGVTFASPNGSVIVDFICPGWGPAGTALDPANGSIDLTTTITRGLIGPLIWGRVDSCRFPVDIAGNRFNVSYDGSIALHFGRIVSLIEAIDLLPITYFADGTVTVDERSFSVTEAFRVTLEDQGGETGIRRLSILVRTDEDESFVYFFDREMGQGIIDARGQLACSLEERRCDLFSW